MLKMFFATGTYASINLINGFEVQQIKKMSIISKYYMYWTQGVNLS